MTDLAMNILRCDTAAPKFDGHFHYYGAIREIKFLDKNMHPYIVYATHQHAKFYEQPRASHVTALENVVK